MWLFVLFLAVPLVEIALFILVGGWIGLWPTLAVVVLTAALGAFLVRREGLRTLSDLRLSLEFPDDPAQPLAHGAAILFAGALLLAPGFFTDMLGLLLLIPAVRGVLFRALARRVRVEHFGYGAPRSDAPPPDAPPQGRRGPGEGAARRGAPGPVIEGEWEEVPTARRPTHRPSGWTRH